MHIPGLKIGFKYHESYLIPNALMRIPSTISQNALKLSIIQLDSKSLRATTLDHFVEQWDEGSKRAAFRGIKAVVAAISLAKNTNHFKNLNERTTKQYHSLIQNWSETFGIPLNGLTALKKVQDMILNDVVKHITFGGNSLEIVIYDIERGTDYSKLREYKVRF